MDHLSRSVSVLHVRLLYCITSCPQGKVIFTLSNGSIGNAVEFN